MPGSKRSILATVLAALFIHCHCYSQEMKGIVETPVVSASAFRELGEQHPAIHKAIRALEAAKGYMEGASHDFCGHRAAALAESNLALNELGLAVSCEKRRDKKGGTFLQLPGEARRSNTRTGPALERHPLIREAIVSLQSARRDLGSTAHEYCGYRLEALEAVNRALAQLKLAVDCDKDQ